MRAVFGDHKTGTGNSELRSPRSHWWPRKQRKGQFWTQKCAPFLLLVTNRSFQGRTPTRPRDKRDKMPILLWNSTENGRFVLGTGPSLSQGQVLFVPGTVPVCPEHRPAQNVYVYCFSCPRHERLKINQECSSSFPAYEFLISMRTTHSYQDFTFSTAA